MKPIKVLHVVSVDWENYYLNNLVDFCDAGEVRFSFVTFAEADCDFVRDMKNRGRTVYALNVKGRREYPYAFRDVAKIMKAENPEIVHTHLFDPSVVGLTVAKWQGRKTVLTRHHSDAVHEITSYGKRKFYLAWEKYVSRKADHIIAPSQMVREILVAREGVASEKVSVIPYGQTTERFDAVTRESVERVQAELSMKRNLALVCVSRLFHRKGHKYLFKAFADLAKGGLDATLYLVGDGDYQAELETAAQRLDISEKIRFLGWRSDALTIMAAADIIVHPSLEDALSSAVIESIMLERPIVATDISGVRDSLDSGKYGEIVEPANAEAFRLGLQNVANNLDEALRIAKAGKKYLLEYMDAKRVADENLAIYQKLLTK